MQSNHTQLLILANTHLTNLFKQNGNDEWFIAEFPYKFDKIEKIGKLMNIILTPP